jgi:hypothetical protein
MFIFFLCTEPHRHREVKKERGIGSYSRSRMGKRGK